MKNYLMIFRDQAFTASWILYKRLLFNTLIGILLVGLLNFVITFPLLLKALGFGMTDLMSYFSNIQQIFNEIKENQEDIGALREIFKSYFTISPTYIILYLLATAITYSWAINLYYTISDNEIRQSNSNLFKAFVNSFNVKIFKILIFNILYFLITMAILSIFMFVFSFISAALGFIGVFLGFVGFLFVLVFLLRFTIGYAAIVHGNMSVLNAMSYSLTHIRWKRGWMLFLMGILFVLAIALLSSIFKLGFSIDPYNYTYTSLIISMFVGRLANGLLFPFIIAATSVLYFRYSSDATEEVDLNEHLINDNDA